MISLQMKNNMDNYVLIDDITDHLHVATVVTNVETCKSVYAAGKKGIFRVKILLNLRYLMV